MGAFSCPVREVTSDNSGAVEDDSVRGGVPQLAIAMGWNFGHGLIMIRVRPNPHLISE